MTKEYKREISFIDADKKKVRLNVEITYRNGYPEFTVSGRYAGSSGQIVDHIKPVGIHQTELVRLWNEYHLKDVSKHVNFLDHVEGVIARIERAEQEREAEAQKLEGDEALLAKMNEEGISEGMLDAVKSYISLGIESDGEISDFEEAYQGQYSSDEEFANEQAESTGALDSDALRSAQWPLYCIDWEWAARELMMDYSEADGYYFRNL